MERGWPPGVTHRGEHGRAEGALLRRRRADRLDHRGLGHQEVSHPLGSLRGHGEGAEQAIQPLRQDLQLRRQGGAQGRQDGPRPCPRRGPFRGGQHALLHASHQRRNRAPRRPHPASGTPRVPWLHPHAQEVRVSRLPACRRGDQGEHRRLRTQLRQLRPETAGPRRPGAGETGGGGSGAGRGGLWDGVPGKSGVATGGRGHAAGGRRSGGPFRASDRAGLQREGRRPGRRGTWHAAG